MDKAERQKRHQERLKLKKEREEKAAEYQRYYWSFIDSGMKALRELPGRSSEHPYSASLLHLPSFEDHRHCRFEWNDVSVIRTQLVWKYEIDSLHFRNMPQGPDDPRLSQDYWCDIKPTFELTQETYSLDYIEELVRLISSIRLPIQALMPEQFSEQLQSLAVFLKVPVRQIAAHSQGMDGQRFELTFSQGEAISTWQYCNDAPEPWKDLEKITEVLLRLAMKDL